MDDDRMRAGVTAAALAAFLAAAPAGAQQTPGYRVVGPVSAEQPQRGAADGERKTHVVERGDTLAEIAAENRVPLTALRKANPKVKNVRRLMPGAVLAIPQANGGTTMGDAEGMMCPGDPRCP